MIKGQGQNKQKRQPGIQISGGRIMAHYVGGGGGQNHPVRSQGGRRSKKQMWARGFTLIFTRRNQ